MKGLKLQPQPSKKDQIKTLETELKNYQMATRMSQMMIQQLISNVKSMAADLSAVSAQLYELQYKYEAVRKLTDTDELKVSALCNDLRLKDFEEAAKKVDDKEGLLDVEFAEEDSTVILTSVAVDELGSDKGIFRSRIKLSDSGSPDLIKALVGKKVGDQAAVTLNGLAHTVKLLSVKASPAQTKSEISH